MVKLKESYRLCYRALSLSLQCEQTLFSDQFTYLPRNFKKTFASGLAVLGDSKVEKTYLEENLLNWEYRLTPGKFKGLSKQKIEDNESLQLASAKIALKIIVSKKLSLT